MPQGEPGPIGSFGPFPFAFSKDAVLRQPAVCKPLALRSESTSQACAIQCTFHAEGESEPVTSEMHPPQSTTLTYTPAVVRRAVWAFWKRSVGITLSLTLVLLTAYLVSLVRGGNTGWLVGVFGTIVALGYGYLASLFVLRLRFEMAALHAMGLPQASLAIDGSGFTVASGAGRASLPWRSVQEVWCYADFWLLFFSASQFMILPTSDLPEAMQAAIREQVRQHGGRLL